MANVRLIHLAATTGGATKKNGLDTDTLLIGKIQLAGISGVSIDGGNANSMTIGKITAAGVGGIAFDAGNALISNVATPVSANDAVNKAYADNLASGLTLKDPVRAATVGGNITLAGGAPSTLDGVTLALNDRILVKDQTTANQNGIYVVQTLGTGANGTWVRATDADTSAKLKPNSYVFINSGTTNADQAYVLSTDGPITLGTTSLTFTQFSGLGQINAGNGLTKSGNTLDVGAGDGITVNADNVQVRLSATPGLQITGGALEVKADTARALSVTAGGVGMVLNATNPGLAFTSTYVDVKYDGARAITAGASGIGLNLNATNPCLAITTNGLHATVHAAGAINRTSTGLQLNLEASNPTLVINGSNQLGVKFSTTASGLETTAAGLAINTEATNPTLQVSGTGELGVKYSATASGLTTGAAGLGVKLEASNPSLQISGTSELGLKIEPNMGLQKGVSGVSVKLTGSTLQITSGGLAVQGLPLPFTINGSVTTSNVTAANLSALTGGGDVSGLHYHNAMYYEFTSGEALNVGDVVYISDEMTVSRASNASDATARVVGICDTTVATAGLSVRVITTASVPMALTGAGGWTPGHNIYLGTGGGTTDFASVPTGAQVVKLGVAANPGEIMWQPGESFEKP